MDCVPAAFYDHCLRFLKNAQDLRQILKPSGLVNPNEDPEVRAIFSIGFYKDDGSDLQHKLTFSFSNGLPAVDSFPEALAISRNLKCFSIYSTLYGFSSGQPLFKFMDFDWNEIRRILKLARHFVEVYFYGCPRRYPTIFYEAMRDVGVLYTAVSVFSPKEHNFLLHQLQLGALKRVYIHEKSFLDIDRHIELMFGLFFESSNFNNIGLRGGSKEFFLENFHRLLTMWANSSLAPKSVRKTITLNRIQLPEDFGNDLPESHITIDGGDCVLSRHLSENESKRVFWKYRDFELWPATIVSFVTL